MVEKVFPHADLIDVCNYILFCTKSRWNDVIIRACRFTNLSAISPFTIKRDLTTQILCLHQAHKFLIYYIVCVLNWYIYISTGSFYSLSRNKKKMNYQLQCNKSRPFVRREILNIHTTHLIELSQKSKYLSNINSFFFPSIEHRCDRSRFSSGYPKPYDKKKKAQNMHTSHSAEKYYQGI